MAIYIILYIILLLSSFTKKYNLLLLWFNIFILSIVAGLRDVSIGPDTITYYDIFNHISIYSESYIDVGWFFINKMVSYVGGYNLFLFLVSLLTLIPIGIISRMYSPNPCLSLFVYYCIYAYLNSFNIMRQVLAISIVFIAYVLYDKNKKTKCALVLLSAMAIHFSSVLGFVTYFVKQIKLSTVRVIILSILSLLLGLLINNTVMSFILGPYAFYLDSSENGYREDFLSSFILAFLVNIIFIFIYYTSKPDLKNSYWYKLYFVGIIIMNITFRLVLGTRIIMFFTLLQFIIYPFYFRNNILKNKKFIFLMIMVYLSAVFFKILILGNKIGDHGSIIPYKTFFL